MPEATTFIFSLLILIMSVVIHEVSHGIAAYLLGDHTAKYAGRLTLNPIPHLDPLGSVILPLLLVFSGSPFLIGWAKPVPFNPYNLVRAPKWGPAIVAAAGPISNLTIALVFGLLLRAAYAGAFPFLTLAFLQIATYITLINIVLAIFNLIPIPPLDGSRVFFSFLPYQTHRLQVALEVWGFFILIFFILVAGRFINILTSFVFHLITGA